MMQGLLHGKAFLTQRHGQATNCDAKHLQEHPCDPSLFPGVRKWQDSSCCSLSWWHSVHLVDIFSHLWYTVPFFKWQNPFFFVFIQYMQVFGNGKKVSKYFRETKILCNWSVVTFMYRTKDWLPHTKHNIHCRYILFLCCSWGLKVLLRTGVRNEKCLDCVGKDGSE